MQKQADIDNLESSNPNLFWKEIGKIGIGQERRKIIPMEIIKPDGTTSSNTDEVVRKWKNDFETLLNPTNSNKIIKPMQDSDKIDDSQIEVPLYFEAPIQTCEVEQAVKRLRMNKSAGIDDIPAEVLKSKYMLNVLCSLYNKCFTLGRIPKIWNRGIIVPVPKSSTSDARDPMSYRGVNITPAVYKLYCNILNDRLLKWEQENSILNDAQNGFRKGRSTIDHVLSLTSIIETRKLKRQPTFAAFIDFRKAYDAIHRKLMFKKLSDLGVSGRMFSAITSLYDNVNCCVRLNSIKTEWFEVTCGLKQGCNLSTILFNLLRQWHCWENKSHKQMYWHKWRKSFCSSLCRWPDTSGTLGKRLAVNVKWIKCLVWWQQNDN